MGDREPQRQKHVQAFFEKRLSTEQLIEVESNWEKHAELLATGKPPRELVNKFSIPIMTNDFSRLKPGAEDDKSWLNDELINFYIELLKMRDQESADCNPRYIRNHFFNSFFMAKLRENGVYEYKKVKQWTKDIDIFSCNQIIIPININGNHWTLAVIDMVNKVIRYYDSMGDAGKIYLDALRLYIRDEWTHKKRTSPPAWMNDWRLIEGSTSTPQQDNNNKTDCGVFVLCTADLLGQGLSISFDHQDLRDCNFRARIGNSILHQQLHL